VLKNSPATERSPRSRNAAVDSTLSLGVKDVCDHLRRLART
jgi:hypothetical protein